MSQAPREALGVVLVGHLAHGKSTLIGRLIGELGALPISKAEAIRAMCDRRSMSFEWALLLDAWQAERDQGGTIDMTQIWLRGAARNYIFIDAPGHKEFVRNMVTGAASADAAILVVDAGEGVCEQTRKHGYLLHMLGVSQIVVAITKMDAAFYAEDLFVEVADSTIAYLSEVGITPRFVIPISGREGDNIGTRSTKMPWYAGPPIMAALQELTLRRSTVELPLRLPVQDVYNIDEQRIFAGRIASGVLRPGDTLLLSPSNKKSEVATIEMWSGSPRGHAGAGAGVGAGESVGITLTEKIFIERGEIASHTVDPPIETDVFRARLSWLGARPMTKGASYTLKLGTATKRVVVQEIVNVVDTDDLSIRESDQVRRYEVAEVVLRSCEMLALDARDALPNTSRFVLSDQYEIGGGGLVSMEGYGDQQNLVTRRSTNVTTVEHGISRRERRERYGHAGGVLWFTGLSGAGKSTLAVEVERRLFERGYQVYMLDGDNVRQGLNANLGFA
ncbi:MAG: GTP-binding protein, partial [Alphaproteobacteria bacterium]